MRINIQKFTAIAETAKSKTTDKRWQNAIDKAVAGVQSGWWVITELADGVMVTTECGQTYHANGSCQCRAYELGQPCKHRALARLVELYNEESAPVAVSQAVENLGTTVPEISTSRARVIASIKSRWPQKFPHDNLSDALMYRFKRNRLEMLSIDLLQAIHAIL